jgi:Sec-independent protein translocase protein TatA
MSADLMTVSKGLKLVYWGLVVVVIAVVLGFLGGLAGVALAAGGGARVLLVVIGIAGVISLVGRALMLVGTFFCLSTPPKARTAKSRITLSVIFTACAVVGSLVSTVDTFANLLPPLLKTIGGGLSQLAQIAGVILFLLFAKALAEFIRRKQLADDADDVLKLVYGLLGCQVISLGLAVAVVALAAGGGADAAGGVGVVGCIAMVVGLAALVLSIMALIKGARLLTELSDAVRVHAKKVRKKEEDEDEGEEEDEPEEDEEDDDRPRRRPRRGR